MAFGCHAVSGLDPCSSLSPAAWVCLLAEKKQGWSCCWPAAAPASQMLLLDGCLMASQICFPVLHHFIIFVYFGALTQLWTRSVFSVGCTAVELRNARKSSERVIIQKTYLTLCLQSSIKIQSFRFHLKLTPRFYMIGRRIALREPTVGTKMKGFSEASVALVTMCVSADA